MIKTFTKTIIFCCLFSICTVSRAQVIHTFISSQADSLITSNNTNNIAGVDSSIPLLNKLFLFLPGTGATPDGYLRILKTAGYLGYHALGLSYVNNATVGSICAGQSDTCQEAVRKTIFYGQPYSPLVTVDSVDGIRTRLIDALKYLNTNYPSEGWGQYLLGPDSINYSKICISGHSQGAGMASLIAYWYPVDRGVFFATGGDCFGATEVTAWMDSTSATPPQRKYAFDHRQDELFWGPSDCTPLIWAQLGLFQYGDYVSVDTLSGDFYDRHCFTSNVVISSSNPDIYHDCVVTDTTTPIVSGVPVYLPVWQYMLTDTSAVIDTATGIARLTAAQKGFEVYPNPASDRIFIDSYLPSTAYEVTISDMAGRKLIDENMKGDSHQTIDVSALAPGLYLIVVGGTTHKVSIR